MGGFFGATSRRSAVLDVFFGTDYHSHLGTRRGGMAAYDAEKGLQREIHNIENSPFRTKFEGILDEMKGNAAIGCISDTDPQPILIRSKLGIYAICTIGVIQNSEELIQTILNFGGGHFEGMSGGRVNANELIASLIGQKDTFLEGIRFAQDMIKGTASILILKDGGHLIAARDKMGRLPIVIEKNEDGYAVTFEDYAGEKLGYEVVRELGPGEIVEISPEGVEVLAEPRTDMKICAFLWSYYGYPTSCYEGKNVEEMRFHTGRVMGESDPTEVDCAGGIPDSGTGMAMGYAAGHKVPYQRGIAKYTPTWPRSFMPANQNMRNLVAKMKLIPNADMLRGKRCLFCDDSIVRGTQLKDSTALLHDLGATCVLPALP